MASCKKSSSISSRKTVSPSQHCFRYRFCEDSRQPVYDVKFCDFGEPYENYLATVGTTSVCIFRLCENGDVELIQTYVDEDVDNALFCCDWTVDRENDHPLLAFGGRRGHVKVIDVSTFQVVKILKGHGDAVNDMQFHPVDENLLLTASKDESIRLWNLQTGTCAVIFAGNEGHRAAVLSIDCHPCGNCFLSSGMDNCVKIWSLEDIEVQKAIFNSYKYDSRKQHRHPFPTYYSQVAAFSTRRVHGDYVDCARWVGNLILSKSTQNDMLFWQPDVRRRKDAANILVRYPLKDSEIWFVRFTLDKEKKRVAVGNKRGRITIWDIDQREENNGVVTGMSNVKPLDFFGGNNLHQNVHTVVRSVAFSPNGKSVVYVCDDGSLWRFDRVEKKKK
eukprot:g3589.t1